MSAGYGRGYYGSAQLASRKTRRSWSTVAAIVGLGAVIWFMLPRSKSEPTYEAPPPPPAPSPQDDLEQLARSRGFSSTKMYEDSVVANARELKAAGAKVVFAPHLAHLEPRLET